jgi:hypothetical protein
MSCRKALGVALVLQTRNLRKVDGHRSACRSWHSCSATPWPWSRSLLLRPSPASGRAAGNGQTSHARPTPSGGSTSEPPSLLSGRRLAHAVTHSARNGPVLPCVHHADVATSHLGKQCAAAMSRNARRDGGRRRCQQGLLEARAQRATPHELVSVRVCRQADFVVTTSTSGGDDVAANPFPRRHMRSRMDERTLAGRGV